MNMHYVVVIYKYFILEYSVIFTVVIPVRERELYLCLPSKKLHYWYGMTFRLKHKIELQFFNNRLFFIVILSILFSNNIV